MWLKYEYCDKIHHYTYISCNSPTIFPSGKLFVSTLTQSTTHQRRVARLRIHRQGPRHFIILSLQEKISNLREQQQKEEKESQRQENKIFCVVPLVPKKEK